MKRALVSLLLLVSTISYGASFKEIDAGTLNPKYKGSRLLIPDGASAKTPGAFVMHGSTVAKYRKERWAGLPEFLAENGYLVLDFCYFECSGNPNFHPFSLIRYDVKKTYDAMVWFKSLPNFSGKFGLYGLSRGAEQALLLTEIMGREKLKVQPAAVILHAPISYVWGSFGWRWTDDEYHCWLCKDGSEDCFKKELSADDQLKRRHLRDDPHSLFVWNSSNRDCGPDPRKLNLTESVSYLWKGKPIPVARQWAKEGPEPLENRSEGHKLDPTYYQGPYMFLHGGKDQLWSPDFSRSLALMLKAFARADRRLEQLDIRPIVSHVITDDGKASLLPDFSSPPRTEGAYRYQKTWHRFEFLENADHAFSDPKHNEIRKKLTLEFFDAHLR